MTPPTTAIAARLLAENSRPLISIYMPTHRAGADIWQDPIRFKNLLRSAQHDLEASGVVRSEIDSLLEPLNELRDNRKFWQYQGDGLALFRSSAGIEEFRLPVRVPEMCVVGDQFHLKPLLMSLGDERRYFVLALSQSTARLFRGSAYGLHEIRVENLPDSDALRTDSVKSLQSHSAGHGTRIPHAAEIDHRPRMLEYCRGVDHAIAPHVGADDFLILAAVDFLVPIFREVSPLRGIAAKSISGNADLTTTDTLFEKSRPIAQDHFDLERTQAESRFFEALGNGRGLDQPKDVLLAARQRRIETLFVPIGLHIWGRVLDSGEVVLSDAHGPTDHDLLNVALVDTWKAGGRVLTMSPDKMPGGRQVAAITRH